MPELIPEIVDAIVNYVARFKGGKLYKQIIKSTPKEIKKFTDLKKFLPLHIYNKVINKYAPVSQAKRLIKNPIKTIKKEIYNKEFKPFLKEYKEGLTGDLKEILDLKKEVKELKKEVKDLLDLKKQIIDQFKEPEPQEPTSKPEKMPIEVVSTSNQSSAIDDVADHIDYDYKDAMKRYMYMNISSIEKYAVENKVSFKEACFEFAVSLSSENPSEWNW